MRILKAFGLVLVVVSAVGAITTSTASANQFHSASSELTTLTRVSNIVPLFEYEFDKTVACITVGGSGEMTSQTVAAVTFSPTYSVCEAQFLFGSDVTVSMNGCDYLFTIEASANKGPVHIQCPEGKQITMTVKVFGFSVCTYHIGKQTPSGAATYANKGSNHVDFSPSLTGISASRQGSSECGKDSSTTGSYSDKWQLKGEITGQTETNVQVG